MNQETNMNQPGVPCNHGCNHRPRFLSPAAAPRSAPRRVAPAPPAVAASGVVALCARRSRTRDSPGSRWSTSSSLQGLIMLIADHHLRKSYGFQGGLKYI